MVKLSILTTIWMPGVRLIIIKRRKPVSCHEREVIESIYCQYSKLMLGVAIKVTHDVASAEDVVHTVFTRLLQDDMLLKGLEDKSKIRGYLINSAYNAAVDYLRSNSMRRNDSLEDYLDLSQPEDTESTVINKEEAGAATKAMLSLKYHYSETLRLSAMGFTPAEIAKRMHVSEGCVKMRITRARQQLRSLLREEDDYE